MPVIEDLSHLFEDAGLAVPPTPDPLAPQLWQQEPWVFTTREIDPMAMYMFGPYIVEAVAESVEDYVAVCHAGQGTNSYAINYHLVHGPLAVFAQTSWGGVYEDPERTALAVREQLGQCAELISAVQAAPDRWPSSRARLVVAESDFRRLGMCGWLDEPLGDEQAARQWLAQEARNEGTDALQTAIEMLRIGN